MEHQPQQSLQLYQQPPQQIQQMRPPQGQALQQMQMMDPFGPMGASPFGGPMGSPFGMLDDMLGPTGGAGFGGLFSQMDQMMRQMHSMPMDGQMMGGSSSQVMMMSSNSGGASYSTQTMMMSSGIGPDGKVHTERFSSSSVGDQARQIKEVQQAYSNSNTGVDKMSLERQMADQGRKMVKERNRLSGEERSTDLFRGISEERADEFDRQWRGQAAPHLPPHIAAGQMALPTTAPQAPRAIGYNQVFPAQPALQVLPPQPAEALPCRYSTAQHLGEQPAVLEQRHSGSQHFAQQPTLQEQRYSAGLTQQLPQQRVAQYSTPSHAAARPSQQSTMDAAFAAAQRPYPPQHYYNAQR